MCWDRAVAFRDGIGSKGESSVETAGHMSPVYYLSTGVPDEGRGFLLMMWTCSRAWKSCSTAIHLAREITFCEQAATRQCSVTRGTRNKNTKTLHKIGYMVSERPVGWMNRNWKRRKGEPDVRRNGNEA